MKHHRNKFFVVLSLVMIVVFAWWMMPVKEMQVETVTPTSPALSAP